MKRFISSAFTTMMLGVVGWLAFRRPTREGISDRNQNWDDADAGSLRGRDFLASRADVCRLEPEFCPIADGSHLHWQSAEHAHGSG
jgi:hypothetical protein